MLLKTTIWVLLLLPFCAAAQEEKFSATLKLFLSQPVKDPRFLEIRNGTVYVAAFLETYAGTSPVSLANEGVVLRTVVDQIATADIPLHRLHHIASLPDVRRIELPLLLQKTDTVLNRLTTVDKVHAALAPLGRAYTGKGIVIGIIDDGICLSHPELVDSALKSRITAYWNMDYEGTPPPGYGYGHFWQKDSLDKYLMAGGALPELQKKFGHAGHGTPVAAIAAGNNGIAPGAEIVNVAFTSWLDTVLRSDRVVDAVAFIYSRAQLVDKRCVINMSFGTMWGGPHDGKTLLEKALDGYSRARPDLLICASAGNNGNDWKHWGGPVHADSSFGLFQSTGKEHSLYFSIPKTHRDSIRLSVSEAPLNNTTTASTSRDSIYYQTPFVRFADILNSPDPVEFKSYLKNGQPSSTLQFTASSYNDDYDELIITVSEHTSGPPGSASMFDRHLYRFIFKGSGTVHGWYPFWNLHPFFPGTWNPFPGDPTYTPNDNEYTSGIPSNGYTILSAGAYNIRDSYVNWQGKTIMTYPTCRLAHFSSHGPTLDGRINPDVIAPGENVLTARSKWETYNQFDFVINSDYQMFSGTSAASPVVAGVAALIWERFPHYTRDSVIARIKSTAYADSFTACGGAVPNNMAGWGKVDAFNALTNTPTSPATFCSNAPYCNSLISYGPPPPPPPPPPAVLPQNSVSVSPNPVTSQMTIRYRATSPLQLTLFNMAGQMVGKFLLPPSSQGGQQTVNLGHLASGVYAVRASNAEITIVQRLVVVK